MCVLNQNLLLVSLCFLFVSSVCLSLLFFRALWHCEDMIQRYSRALNNSSVLSSGALLPHCSFSNVGKAVEDCMRAVIGVLLNLTHDNGTAIFLAFVLFVFVVLTE